MIRPVAARDVHAIAALQVRAWRAAYTGFVDEDRMPTVEDRIGLWNGVRPGEAWLLEHAEAALRGSGHTVALLWTFRENAPSRAFYEHHGWVADGTEQELWPGVFEVRYRRQL